MAKKRLKAILIGTGGNMRGAHIPRIQQDRSVDVVGLADPIEEAAQKAVDRLGSQVMYFDNWRDMLAQVESDVALISTPHSDHNAQAKACLESGMHVLIEKPMVLTTAHANGLIALAKKKKLCLHVAYQRHWMREYVFARELISTGKIGKIQSVVGYVVQNWLDLGGWRLDAKKSGGGMFMDTGSHLVASALWITGLQPVPKSISATMDKQKRDVDVNTVVQMQFKGGAVGTLSAIGSGGEHDEQLVVVGDKGTLCIRLHGWRVVEMTLNGSTVSIPTRIKASNPDAGFFAAVRTAGQAKAAKGRAGRSKAGSAFEYPTYAVEVARLSTAAYRSIA